MKSLRSLLVLGAAAVLGLGGAWAQRVPLGSGAFLSAPRAGDPVPPPATGRTEAMARLAAPTNQWYSAWVFGASNEVIYAQPLSFRRAAQGMEVAWPLRDFPKTERGDVDVVDVHSAPITVGPAAFEPGAPRLAQQGDWSVVFSLGQGSDDFRVSMAHGSPYAQFELSRGDYRVRAPAGTQTVSGAAGDDKLVLQVGERRYALFAPAGSRWVREGEGQWLVVLPEGRRYLSLAALPDATPESLALLARHAHVHVSDTRAHWSYDAASSRVRTEFRTTSKVMEGPALPPLLGLYPHHWRDNPQVAPALGPSYATIRGPVRLLAAPGFELQLRHHGFVPWWPRLPETSPRRDELGTVMRADLRNARRMMLEIGDGPYWQGKGLQRITKLLDVVEQEGDAAAAKSLLELLQDRMQTWLGGDARKTYFVKDARLGTVLGYPEEYFSVTQLNDHHFHYGYWIRAAAEIALRDPQWARAERWGGMVDLLVADIATAERGRADFPFLRTFDVYEGHSWASGVALGPHGNNQESSSEAVNAWVGLILWGEVTGRPALRDLGVWLYAMESHAIKTYWFDAKRQVFPPQYPHVEVSMVFGGRLSHNTWWTDEPRQIKGINLLPMTTASTYLADDPEYIRRNVGTLPADMRQWTGRGKSYGLGPNQVPKDIWQDIFAKYLSLADPAAGLAQWDRWGAVELGDTRTHTLHWLLSLSHLGVPDTQVVADTPLYAVFRRPDGTRTHMAYNAGPAPLRVRFSDGVELQVAPGQLARSR